MTTFKKINQTEKLGTRKLPLPRVLLVCCLIMLLPLQAAILHGAESPPAQLKRDFYFPNTEPLPADAMRVIALGTGTPHIRPAQAATSWLVELGNGDKFLFDIGTGSIRNLSALQIPYDELSRVFISHLHVDHVGDLDALWASGWTAGRMKHLQVWGPSGTSPRLGTEHYVKTLKEAFYWDYATRTGKMPSGGGEIDVHEFDYRESQTVYERNGVKIRSFPAIHVLDGAVSYRLDWNGLSFVFSGDTIPNKWMVETARGVDLLVHEVYMTIDQLMTRFGWDRNMATNISRVVHTTPAAAGKIYSMLSPRMAVGFHFYNDLDAVLEIEKGIRETYEGDLALAEDMMVFDVTAESIRVRKAITPTRIWPSVLDRKKFAEAHRGEPIPMSVWLQEGQLAIDIYK